MLTVAVPVLTTDSLTWSCSGEAPARQCLVTRSLLPMLSEGSARATDADTTDDILLVRLAAAAAAWRHLAENASYAACRCWSLRCIVLTPLQNALPVMRSASGIWQACAEHECIVWCAVVSGACKGAEAVQ